MFASTSARMVRVSTLARLGAAGGLQAWSPADTRTFANGALLLTCTKK
ncbi:hypothetical protein [Actinoallomurus sp. NPDC052274]